MSKDLENELALFKKRACMVRVTVASVFEQQVMNDLMIEEVIIPDVDNIRCLKAPGATRRVEFAWKD